MNKHENKAQRCGEYPVRLALYIIPLPCLRDFYQGWVDLDAVLRCERHIGAALSKFGDMFVGQDCVEIRQVQRNNSTNYTI